MDRLTLPALLMTAMLVVSFGAAGAVAAPSEASGAATASMLQEGDGNTTDTPAPNGTATNDTNAATEPTFGAVVSSFMQTTDADAETEVEDGMFAARFDRSNASERARLVQQRAARLGDRVAELREERDELLAGENVTVRERAEAARLATQSRALAGSVDQTEAAAQRANVQLNRTALERLRTEAANLTGPEVAELARGLVDREEPPRRGPPEDTGPPGVDSEGTNATNRTVTPDSAALPGESGDAPGRNRSDGDPPRGDGDSRAGGPSDGGDTDGAPSEADDADEGGADQGDGDTGSDTESTTTATADGEHGDD